MGEEIELGAKLVRRGEILAELRASVRCGHCQLVQFVSGSRSCKRCRRLLWAASSEVVSAAAIDKKLQEFRLPIGEVMAEQRQRLLLSQRQLALGLQVTRQWVAKVERGELMPDLRSVCRFAAGLGMSGWELLKLAEERGMTSATESEDAA